MIGKLLVGATFTAAVLAATPLFADPGHQHGQNATCTENCPNTPPQAQSERGAHGMGRMHARMQAMHGDAQGKAPQGMQRGENMPRGNKGEGCPMHEGRKPT